MKLLNYLILYFFCFTALFAPLIANDQPIAAKLSDQWLFPALSTSAYIELKNDHGEKIEIKKDNIDWKSMNTQFILFPPVPYSPQSIDLINGRFTSPFDSQWKDENGVHQKLPLRFRHWMGTNKLGQDVLSGLIHGCRTAVVVGFFAMLIAMFIGIILGAAAGYFQNSGLKISRLQLILILLMIIPSGFYCFILFPSEKFTGLISAFILLIRIIFFAGLILWPLLLRQKKKNQVIPVDTMVSSAIEILLSLPRLLLLLVIASITGSSVLVLILIIGITSWTEIARLVRVQVMRIKTLDYVPAAEISGASIFRIWTRHIFPNALRPVMMVWIFGIAAAVLVETSLSFIGAGSGPAISSWGKMMYEARENYQAWWLVVFPGIALFLLLFALHNVVGNTRLKSRQNNTFINKF